jgi:hypothetical protein
MKNNHFIYYIVIILIGAFWNSCGYTKPVRVAFDAGNVPAAPNYSDTLAWAALPEMKDSADHIPAMGLIDIQPTAWVDVFYIHPTSYFSRNHWNAPIDLKKMVAHTDKGTMTHQASVFNGSCKIYAPRYRQATYQAFFSLDNPDSKKAFDLAYADIKAAFEYYLSNHNQGRPIIIAGHSQGTILAKWLLQEYFDGKPLQNKLVAAYLVGMPVYDYDFQHIEPCSSIEDLECYMSWRSYQQGHLPKPEYAIPDPEHVVLVNPISWSMDTTFAPAAWNIGGLSRSANKIIPQVCGTQIHGDILWTTKPDVPGKALLLMRNYHRADYNLYWMNIRYNVGIKVERYLEQHQ